MKWEVSKALKQLLFSPRPSILPSFSILIPHLLHTPLSVSYLPVSFPLHDYMYHKSSEPRTTSPKALRSIPRLDGNVLCGENVHFISLLLFEVEKLPITYKEWISNEYNTQEHA